MAATMSIQSVIGEIGTFRQKKFSFITLIPHHVVNSLYSSFIAATPTQVPRTSNLSKEPQKHPSRL
jgi:hypothetical protein